MTVMVTRGHTHHIICVISWDIEVLSLNILLYNVYINPQVFLMQDFLPKKGKQKIMCHGGTGVRTMQSLTGHQNAWELDEYAF